MSAERSTYAAAACASRTAQFKALRSSKVLRDLTVLKALLARLDLLGQTVRKDLPAQMAHKDRLDLPGQMAHQAPWDLSAPQALLALPEDRALGQTEQVQSQPRQTWG
jgi:hypothetical protein